MKLVVGSNNQKITKRQRVLRAASLWVLILLIAFSLVLIYRGTGVGIPCPFNAVTGLYCYGCGMFRAIEALLRGNVWQAVPLNALAVILLPMLTVLLPRETVRYVRAEGPSATSRIEVLLIAVVIAVSIAYAVARNLPVFSYLQPTVLLQG